MTRRGEARRGEARRGEARRGEAGPLLIATALLAACADPSPTPIVGHTSERLSLVGVERVVPIRFVSLPANGVNPNGTWADVSGAVQVTNQAFRDAGVQFQVAAVDRFVAPQLPFVSATVANPDAALPNQPPTIDRYCDRGLVSWGSIQADLTSIFPAIAGFSAVELPAAADTMTTQQWLFYAASRFAPREEIVAYIPACGGLYGTYPHEGRALTADRWSLPDWWKFAHEMGHVFGLSHADERGTPNNIGESAVCIPSATSTCSNSTGAGLGNMTDFWDMVYLPGTSSAVPHRTFGSKSEAMLVDATKLRWIDDGLDDGAGNRCTIERTDVNVFGRMHCTLPGPGGYSEFWDTDDPATESKLRGYMWRVSGGHRGRAMMSYRLEPTPTERSVHAGFSDSQANIVRLTLRFDQPSQSGTPVGSKLLAAGVSAGRPFLGRALRRRPLEVIDFDDDGLRDLAIWSPPTTAGGTGTFRVFGSRGGFAAQGVRNFGELGDIPVVADYNGDGITDYAVYHDNGGLNTDGRVWRWCLSTPGAPTGGTPPRAPPTHDCTSPGTYTYGIRGDVPIPGTRLFPNSAHELSVYRPSTGYLFTYSSTQGHTPLNLGILASEGGQTPYVASFDVHSGHDVAYYNPQNAKFSMWLSASGWTSRVDRSFCPGGLPCTHVPSSTGSVASRGGAVPAWGLATQKVLPGGLAAAPAGALGLWDPSNGTWSVMWDPTASSAIESHQWGYQEDLLVPGAVGLKASDAPFAAGARSDLVVYRSGSTSGPGMFLRCAFPAGAGACPSPVPAPATVDGGSRRWEVFTVADMVGDGKPELCAFDPQLQVIRCLRSDTGYSPYSVITATFTNSTPPYSIVGAQLL